MYFLVVLKILDLFDTGVFEQAYSNGIVEALKPNQ